MCSARIHNIFNFLFGTSNYGLKNKLQESNFFAKTILQGFSNVKLREYAIN